MVHLTHHDSKSAPASPTLDHFHRNQWTNSPEYAPGTAFFGFRMFGGLYPVYVRGQAYLSAGRGEEAAAEFQKVLDHRGIVLADPIGALAHLQLGRAYIVSGDKIKARNAYQDFFHLWKDADADIPVLRRASAEYAKL